MQVCCRLRALHGSGLKAKKGRPSRCVRQALQPPSGQQCLLSSINASQSRMSRMCTCDSRTNVHDMTMSLRRQGRQGVSSVPVCHFHKTLLPKVTCAERKIFPQCATSRLQHTVSARRHSSFTPSPSPSTPLFRPNGAPFTPSIVNDAHPGPPSSPVSPQHRVARPVARPHTQRGAPLPAQDRRTLCF